jgi:hypothetical protein
LARILAAVRCHAGGGAVLLVLAWATTHYFKWFGVGIGLVVWLAIVVRLGWLITTRAAAAEDRIEALERELASAKEQFDRDLRELHEVLSDWHEQRLADVFDAARREGFTVEIEHADVPTVGQGPMFYFANSNRTHRSYTIITASRNDVIETLREMGAALHGL